MSRPFILRRHRTERQREDAEWEPGRLWCAADVTILLFENPLLHPAKMAV